MLQFKFNILVEIYIYRDYDRIFSIDAAQQYSRHSFSFGYSAVMTRLLEPLPKLNLASLFVLFVL